MEKSNNGAANSSEKRIEQAQKSVKEAEMKFLELFEWKKGLDREYFKENYLEVLGFENGVATVKFPAVADLFWIHTTAFGCFGKNPTLKYSLFKCFDIPEQTELRGIAFVFNGIPLCITSEDEDVVEFVNNYIDAMKA